jgi:NitT/TauT family transport system substrate-binding protein
MVDLSVFYPFQARLVSGEGFPLAGTWCRAACAAAAVAALAAGCSSGGGSAAAGSNTMSALSIGPAEKTTLNVGMVPAMDSAGFFVALHEGLFAKEGLTINYTPAVSSDTVIGSQLQGQLDITGGNYVSYIQAVAEKHDYLLDVSVLSENGVNMDSVKFPAQPIPFPDMAGELSSGKIDAATMPEPFASIAEQQLGAVTLADLNQGATQEFPIEGYVVTKAWAKAYPNTLRRFLAALEQGQEIADTNRAAVEQAFKTITGGAPDGQVPSSIAALMALNTYPIGIDQARLQRVADVMHQFGLLPNRFDVGDMLLPASDFDYAAFSSS